MNCFEDDWKITILRRYCGEFPPHSGASIPIRKSSEDIVSDLAEMGEFSANEVSAYLAVSGYKIEFDDSRPVWLLQRKIENCETVKL